MTVPRFVPLACPHCGGDLTGGAEDVVAFCRRCRAAWKTTGLPLTPVAVEHRDAPESVAPVRMLPFWRVGGLLLPAFPTRRPLSLARLATAAGTRPTEAGPPDPPPVGVRFDADQAARLLPLLDAPRPASVPERLVALPLLRDAGSRRFRLEAARGWIFDEDLDDLLSSAR